MRPSTKSRPIGERIQCACGCKRWFIRDTDQTRYFSEGCKDEARRARARVKRRRGSK